VRTRASPRTAGVGRAPEEPVEPVAVPTAAPEPVVEPPVEEVEPSPEDIEEQ